MRKPGTEASSLPPSIWGATHRFTFANGFTVAPNASDTFRLQIFDVLASNTVAYAEEGLHAVTVVAQDKGARGLAPGRPEPCSTSSTTASSTR